MKQSFFDRIPTDLPGGFFVYRATGEEELCFADRNVLTLYGCDTLDEFRTLTKNSFRGMVHPEDLDRVENEIYSQTFHSGDRHDYVYYRICTKSGEVKFVEDFGHLVYNVDGESFFYVFIVVVEETEYKKLDHTSWEERIVYRRTERRNALTGLIYEDSFFSACKRKLANFTINWLLIAIDIPNFKLFNEWYGREKGDQVLAAIGHELNQLADAHTGVAGYFGGDDFALLVPAGHFDTDALFDCILKVITGQGASVGFLPAIGASYSQGNMSPYTLYDQASLAINEAKADRRTRVKFFSQVMVRKAEEDYKVLSEFKDALSSGEITFYLQPQCRSATGQIVGAEALARWIKPDGKVVPPISFIPVLERYGFVPDLDKYIWEQVCQWTRKILDEGKTIVPVSVNVSPVDIFTMDVPHYIEEMVSKYHLPKDVIKIEITESAYSEGSDKVRSTVQELRNKGFVVLMDDFGSGYSSLNMLRELNVDIIKLDAYFLRMEKSNERKGMNIIESVVNMAKTMAMPVVVEGVETEQQCKYLMDLGIKYIQGYYFYKPMCTEEFECLISDSRKVDPRGFVYKANEEFRIREFLNDTVYSDSMLNHIIGPAAIYSLNGDDIDIIRFNEMFYRAVNVPDFQSKLLGIQKLMPPSEVEDLFLTLKKAYDDRLNGSSGVFTFMKIDGSAARFLIHFYFLSEDGEQRRFYGSATDVTEITNLYWHMELLSRLTPRTVLFLLYSQGKYSFEVPAHGLEKEMGLSRKQLEEELNTETFYKRLNPSREKTLWIVAQSCAEEKKSVTVELEINRANQEPMKVIADANYIDDELGDVKCILTLRKK